MERVPDRGQDGHHVPIKDMRSRGELTKLGDSRRIDHRTVIASWMRETLVKDDPIAEQMRISHAPLYRSSKVSLRCPCALRAFGSAGASASIASRRRAVRTHHKMHHARCPLVPWPAG